MGGKVRLMESMSQKNIPIVTDVELSQESGLKVSKGIRFFKDGHWWEVERGVQERMHKYFQCKPVCYVETRSYSEMEIIDSLWKENEKVCKDRGTGRIDHSQNHGLNAKVIFINKKKDKVNVDSEIMSKKETLKILLVGSRDKVKELKEKLQVIFSKFLF
jgi:hypothetical protein